MQRSMQIFGFEQCRFLVSSNANFAAKSHLGLHGNLTRARLLNADADDMNIKETEIDKNEFFTQTK